MACLIKRGGQYYIQYYLGGKARRQSCRTTLLQVAKEKQRQFESAEAQDIDKPLPILMPRVAAAFARFARLVPLAERGQVHISIDTRRGWRQI